MMWAKDYGYSGGNIGNPCGKIRSQKAFDIGIDSEEVCVIQFKSGFADQCMRCNLKESLAVQ